MTTESDIAIWDATAMGETPGEMDELEDPHKIPWVFRFVMPLYCAIVIFGLLSNSWMIYHLLKFSTLHIVSKIYLMNRALADLLLLANIPLFIDLISTLSWSFGKFGCQVFFSVISMHPISPGLFLGAMCLDFFVVHRYPTKAKQWRTPSQACAISLVVWILTTFYVAPIASNADIKLYGVDHHCGLHWPQKHLLSDPRIYLLYRLVFDYITPLVVVAAISVFLLRTHSLSINVTAEEHTELRNCDNSAGINVEDLVEPNHGKGKQNCQDCSSSDVLCWKLAVVLSTLIFLPWVPFFLAEIYLEFMPYDSSKHQIAFEVGVISICLAFSMVVVNPMVVIFMSMNIDPWQYLRTTFSNFQRHLLRCGQFKTLNQVCRRTRWSSWRPFYNTTSLEDVRTFE